MNTRLNQLLEMLNSQSMGVVTQAELIDALRLISAHHNLEAIVTCTRRIFEFEQLYPNLLDHPIENLAPRLDILRRISQLVFAEEHFKQSHLPKDSPCPLTPFTAHNPNDLDIVKRVNSTLIAINHCCI